MQLHFVPIGRKLPDPNPVWCFNSEKEIKELARIRACFNILQPAPSFLLALEVQLMQFQYIYFSRLLFAADEYCELKGIDELLKLFLKLCLND